MKPSSHVPWGRSRGTGSSGNWILFLISLLVFLPCLLNGFVLDDFFYISSNPVLQHPGQWPRFLYDPSSLLSEHSLSRLIWRPLLGLSYGVNRFLLGPDPFWFHGHDILLHAANTMLALALLRRLAGPGPHSWAGALLFCCHPVQAQAVAYAGARPSLLSLFFSLASFLLYAGPSHAALARGTRLALAAGAFCLGLLSKESTLFLLPVLAALEWVEVPDDRERAASARRLALFAAAGAIYLAVRASVLGMVAQRGPWGGDWLMHFQLASHGLFKTVSLVFWPKGLREPYGFILSPWFMAESVLMASALSLAAGFSIWGVWKRRAWGMALFWVFAALLPVSNIVPFGSLAADRYLYGPMAGVGLLAALSLKGRLDGWVKAGAAVVAAVMVVACAEAQLQWRSGFVLDLAACAAAPKDPYPPLRLASHYLEWRMLPRAEELAVRGLEPQAPPDVRRLALKRLAVVRMAAGRFTEARELLEACLSMDPGQRSVRELLAKCCLAMGDVKAGQAHLLEASVLP